MARVEPSSTTVEEPEPSARTQPVTVTVPDGGAGRSVGTVPVFGRRQPAAVDEDGCAGVVRSGVTRSTPGCPSRVW